MGANMTCFAVKYFDLDPFWPCQAFPKEHTRKYGPDWIGKTWTGLIKHGLIQHIDLLIYIR